MYIKQWLQQPLQKRQCAMIIDETLWQLAQQGVIKLPKSVEREVDSTRTNAFGQPMRCYERWYEGSNDFYQQLLDYRFDESLEFRFLQCLQALNTKLVPIDEILAVFTVQSPTVQNIMCGDGTIKEGLDHDAALSVFRVLTHLVVNKYVSNV